MADPCGVDELQALHTEAARQPDSKSATLEGLDGELLGSRDSPDVRHGPPPPKTTTTISVQHISQDVASNPRSLVQLAEQLHPLLQRRPPAYRMREYRSNHAHEKVVVVGDAASLGRHQVTQEGHIGRAGQDGKTWAGGKEK